MKKDYNRDVMSDMPVDASFTPSVETKTNKKTTSKPKISAIGTQKRTTNSSKTTKTTKTTKSSENAKEEVTTMTASAEVSGLGEGETQFIFTVTDAEGVETAFEIHTDKEIVGEALSECGLIEGEDGAYGLYVKKVNGILADYDVDGTYWAFYINGEYASTGVDATTITAGDTYSFKVEK